MDTIFICIESPSAQINAGDVVVLLQDNATIYNRTTKLPVYNHSEYIYNPTYFKKYIEADTESPLSGNTVQHPTHYTSHPSGIECIEITKYYDFCIGSAIKYLWRAGLKTEEGKSNKEKEIEDLKKAITFIQFKINTLINEK